MGVKGLSSYITHYRKELSTVRRFDGRRHSVPVIADGLGIMFNLYFERLRWEDGGEYALFYRLVRQFVKAWRAVGIEPVFVFDGSKPLAKHRTIVQRVEESIRNSAKYHQLLADSTHVTHVRGKRIMPIFCFSAMVAALSSMKVSMEFVPEGEADAAVVSIAQKRGAYILGNDSDFIILAAGASNVRGYIQTDGVQWISPDPKQRKRPVTLVPPEKWVNPALHVLVYSTPALCKLLGVPSSSLALLASLVGNDYMASEMYWNNTQQQKGDGETDTAYWRVEHTAAAIRRVPFPELTSEADAVGYVRAIMHAMKRQPRDETVSNVITAMLQYALPDVSRCCPADPFCQDENCGLNSSTPPTPEVVAYANAQRAGRLKPLTNAFMAPDRLYPWALAEDPSYPSARSSWIAKDVRRAAYQYFFAALYRLDKVTEYDRNADLKLEASDLNILPGRPICLAPLHLRIRAYLAPFGPAAAHAIGELPPYMHPLAAALRMCLLLPEAHGPWTHADAYAITRAGLGSLAAFEGDHAGDKSAGDGKRMYETLTSRSAQRVAQLSGNLHDLHTLAESLLLSTPGPIKTHLFGWKFVGPALHRLLAGRQPGSPWTAPDEVDVRRLVEAAITGLTIAQYGVGIDLPSASTNGRRKLQLEKRKEKASSPKTPKFTSASPKATSSSPSEQFAKLTLGPTPTHISPSSKAPAPPPTPTTQSNGAPSSPEAMAKAPTPTSPSQVATGPTPTHNQAGHASSPQTPAPKKRRGKSKAKAKPSGLPAAPVTSNSPVTHALGPVPTHIASPARIATAGTPTPSPQAPRKYNLRPRRKPVTGAPPAPAAIEPVPA